MYLEANCPIALADYVDHYRDTNNHYQGMVITQHRNELLDYTFFGAF